MKIYPDKVQKALEVLAALPAPDSGFPNALKGDISSFGASIVQAGLLPSVLFFSEGKYEAAPVANTEGYEKWVKKWDDTKTRRARLMAIICQVAGKNLTDLRPLFEAVRPNPNDPNLLDDITEAALAIKIAMRAFKFDESKKSENN